MAFYRQPKALIDGSTECTNEQQILELFCAKWHAHPDDYDPTDAQMRELIAYAIDIGKGMK